MSDQDVEEKVRAAQQKMAGVMQGALVNGDVTMKAWEQRALAWTLFCFWLSGLEYAYNPKTERFVWKPGFELAYTVITLKVSE